MIKEIKINKDLVIPIEVKESEGQHIITIDGVEWIKIDNQVHAAVLFNMIADHITEYMNYSARQ